ncbi:MAG: NAD-dependent epimerase/dehydratase family protein [candidate division WOR-3 bacterium]
MNVLVTGGAGYIGSVLCRELLERGHKVIVLDALFFGDMGIRDLLGHPGFKLIKGDIRVREDISRAIENTDAVIHLAALVGEPAASRWPELNRSINIDGTRNLLSFCGERLFLYASSCSVYGNQEGLVDEESPTMALGPYAESRIAGEEMVRGMAKNFVILRFATAFGLSPRMRFDLLVNEFVLSGWRRGIIEIYNPQITRPFVHLADLSRAVCGALGSQPALGRIVNIGMGNFSKAILAEKIARITGAEIREISRGPDIRNYTISFERMEKLLGLKGSVSIEDGAREILMALERGKFPNPDDPIYYNHSPVYGV